jgi:hypothetical protein
MGGGVDLVREQAPIKQLKWTIAYKEKGEEAGRPVRGLLQFVLARDGGT